MKIKLLKEHLVFNKRLVRLDNIDTITDKGLSLKDGSFFKLKTGEVIKVMLELGYDNISVISSN